MERQRTFESVWTSCIALTIAMSMVGAALGQSNGGCWLEGEPLPGIDGVVTESLRWDPDGNGPSPAMLIFAGGFTTAGNVAAANIVGWNQGSWITFGDGLPGQVRGLAEYQGQVIASYGWHDGLMWHHGVALWNGTAWGSMGVEFDSSIEVLMVYDGDLIAGGWFTQAGVNTARGLARWDGGAWVEFAGGVAPQNPGFLTPVNAMHEHNGSLFIGGSFGYAGGVAARNVARWDGASWHPLTTGANGFVYALATHQGQLAVGGNFSTAGGVAASAVAIWNGATWISPGGGITGSNAAVITLKSFMGELYAGGVFFNYYQQLSKIARWNGTSWSSPGGGTNLDVRTLISDDQFLYAGGFFTRAGDTGANGIGRWDGGSWSTLSPGLNDSVMSIEQFDDRIVIGGRFERDGETVVPFIAQSGEGGAWQPMDQGMGRYVYDLQHFRGDLVACGFFDTAGGVTVNNIARWDGTRWNPMGSGLGAIAYCMTEFQGELVVGGSFSTGSGMSLPHVARWDGVRWRPMGLGADAFPGFVYAFCKYQGKLYAAGSNWLGTGAYLAKWTGQRWLVINDFSTSGTSTINALTTYRGELIAAGRFTINANGSGKDIARWDGQHWSPMGSGVSLGGSISALAVVHGSLVAGGIFDSIDGVSAYSIARWHNDQWSAMQGGVRGGYRNVLQLNLISGVLHVVGGFALAGDRPSAYFARWRPSGGCSTDFAPESGDGQTNVAELLAVIGAWGECDGCAPDVTHDDRVDVADLLAVIGGWGPCP